MTNNHGSCHRSGCRLVGCRVQKKSQLQAKSSARLQVQFIFALNCNLCRRLAVFSTIYTDIIMINNAQTCHMLVSCVFDWSALGSRAFNESGSLQSASLHMPSLLSAVSR